MSDWDFLHEMHSRGYSAADIADAAGCGYAPWEAVYIEEQETKDALKELHFFTPPQLLDGQSGVGGKVVVSQARYF